VAAALAFWHTHRNGRDLRYILLLKLGSRECRATIAAIDNWIDSIEIIGTRGSGDLGGNRYTHRLVNNVIEDIRAKHGIDITNDQIARAFLYNACEQVKHTLSTENEAVITVKSSLALTNFTASITKYDFELLSFDLVVRTIYLVQQVLDDCLISKSSINDVVVFGGSANTVDFTEPVSHFFDRTFPDQLLNPNDLLAYGSAVHSAIFTEPCVAEYLSRMSLQRILELMMTMDR
jgi:molecular chaperone DnaK (HSP70)